MAEHKTSPSDKRTGVFEKKDAEHPMSYEEAKAKGHADVEGKGHSPEKGKGPRKS
jgi:hypothetical protein